MSGMRRTLGLIACLTIVNAMSANADSPADTLAAAVRATAGARTARVSIAHHVTISGRTSDAIATGVLVAGDSDLQLSGEGGGSRRVAVGPRVKERRPDAQGASWRESSRIAPTQTTALGPLTLADGRSIGDPSLYSTVSDMGMDTVAQGSAQKLVGELNMSAVASAMLLSPADRSRMATWTGTLTLWLGADGRVVRNAIRLVIPASSGPTTVEAQIDISDLDAPLSITLP
jgi:hypothetical protein